MPINTALQMILARLAADGAPGLPRPAPSAPIPLAPTNLGPLSDDTSAAFAAQNPEPVPPNFIQPGQADMNFVDAYSGPAPARPVIPNATTLQKIAAVLSGIGAGPGYGLALKEQREEPIRKYERDLERYQGRRAQGIELADRRAEREAAQANRLAEAQYERDYNLWLKRNGDRDDASKLKMQQMFQLERDARQARLEEERAQRLERRQREDDARQRAGILGTGPGAAPPAIAKELGAYYANLAHELSPAAAKWQNAQAKRAEILAGRASLGGRGGTGMSNAAMKALANFNAALEEVRGAVGRGDVRSERLARRKLDAMYGRLSQFPGQIERGIGAGWPWAKPAGQSTPAPGPGAQPQGPTRTMAQVRAIAQQAGISEQEAIQRAQAAGFTITQ